MGKSLVRNNTFKGDSVPKLTKILFPWSGIFRDACYALIGTFLIQYAITSGVLSKIASEFSAQYGVITIAMMIALLWDGINDPIMGFILEKCHFKAGKFRPWIEIGAIGNAICVATMFLAPALITGLRGWGYVVFMIVMYVLWDTCFTMNDIGYWSMLPALTNDPKQRASITTQTAIAATIGTFVMNIMMFALPGTFKGVSTSQIYMWTGLFVAAFFLASQTVVFFLCKEKERDAIQEEVSEKSSLLDLFRVVIKNKQLGCAALGMLLYYFGSFILTGIGQNYFYMVFGYGGDRGGMVATAISVIYVLATIFAQAFYPMIAKKLPKKKIILISGIIIFVAYLTFLLIAFPFPGAAHPIAYNNPASGGLWFVGGTMFLYYVFSFLFFGASGIFYLTILVMFQDAIDYNEWKYGERKESICFAWRPLDVKLASGLNRGLQYLTFAVTGTVLAINSISNWEGMSNALSAAATNSMEKLAIGNLRDANIEQARLAITSTQLFFFGVIIIVVILLCFGGAMALLQFGYKIDEKLEEQIVKELAIKNAEDNKAAEEAAAPAPAEEEQPKPAKEAKQEDHVYEKDY